MVSDVLKKIYNRLDKIKFFARIFDVLGKTPKHAVHWYIIILVGLLLTVISIGLTWVTFLRASVDGATDLGGSVNAITIDREELRGILEVYRNRTTEFNRLQQTAPMIIDPGR